jgi:PPK2 family polyphosphate:nucleotide phosphotransferase
MPDSNRKQLTQLAAQLRVQPGVAVHLKREFDPGYTAESRKEDDARDLLDMGIEVLTEYQDRLAADGSRALLVVLQGMDASGKDGVIKHVMSGVNPQWVDVHAFKEPSAEELRHDFLWRYEQKLPPRGMITIFNRSHYEEVLVVRVHPQLLVTQHLKLEDDTWQRRFRAINEWERYLVENGIHVVKLFLNLSKQEQRRRFLARIDEPEKNWKFRAEDVREREHWDAYHEAYRDVLKNTSTAWAPWHVIPADHKWFERVAVAAVVVDALLSIDPHYPSASPAERKALAEARHELLSEAE